MSPPILYAVDTCSLTTLKRAYPRDVVPQFWELTESLIQARRLLSSEEVLEELKALSDDLLAWASSYPDIFVQSNARIQLEVKRILRAHPKLVDLKKSKSGADPFLLAVASLHGAVLVTEERPSGGPERQKIPDVCRHLSIECIPLIEMFRREGKK